MSLTIHKYPLGVSRAPVIAMPKDARLLSIKMQRNNLVLWALVDDAAPVEFRHLIIYDTGDEIPDPGIVHLATMQSACETWVWHIFEKLPRGLSPRTH